MTSKTYVGDTGTIINLDTGVSLTGASSVKIEAQKPDGTSVEWIGSISGTSVQYTTQTGDLSQAGAWTLQAKVALGSGLWLGESVAMMVYPAFG